MRDFDPDAFEERAAIAEFCGGMSRFDAETMAAKAQGIARWQAIKSVKEATDANGRGSAGGSRNQDGALDRQRNANDMPGMQRGPKEENRPLPERVSQAGWVGLVLLALLVQGGAAV